MNQTSMSPQTSGSAGSAAPRTAAPSATREYSEFLETNRRQDRRRPQTRGPLPALAGVFALLILWSAVPALSDEPGAPQPPAAVPVASQDAGQEKRVGTVTMTNVDDKFIQNGGSCVLSSYAIVGNYFTGKPISAFFEGYCRHFGIAYADAADAEQKYAAHFDAEWRKRKCMGYEVILDLHSNSTEKCFADARRVFDARFYLESSKHLEELEHMLNTREAFLNITYEPGGDYHSITVMNDGTRLMARDTNRNGFHPIPGLRKIGKLRDSVLYVRK